jgi:hypothetical protein
MLSVLSPWNVISSRMPVFSGLSRKEELRILERGAIMSYSSEQLMRLFAPVYEKTLFWTDPWSGLYEIDLFRTTPSKQPKRKTKHIPLAFIAGSQSYLNAFLDLFDLLRQKGMPILLILPRQAKTWSNSLAEVQKKNNIQIVYIEDYYDEKLKEELYSLRGIFQERFLSNQHLLKKIVRIGQSNLYSQTKLIFKRLFSEYLPELVIYNKIATRILTDYGVKTLVGVRLKIFIENSFFLAAKNKGGIKKLSLVHTYHSDMLDIHYDLSQVDLADIVFVPSEHDRQLYEERKGPRSKTKIVNLGNPQMQKIYDGSIKKHDYRRKFGFNKGYIVLMTGIKSFPLSWVRHVVDECRAADYPLIIKTHPRETKDRYICFEKKGAKVVDSADVDLYPLMKEATAVISYGSTTSIESLLLGTPSFFYEGGLRCEPAAHFIFEFYKRLGLTVEDSRIGLRKRLAHYYSVPKKEAMKPFSHFIKLYSPKSKRNITSAIINVIKGEKKHWRTFI